MAIEGKYGIVQLKHIGKGEFLKKEFKYISPQKFQELGCTEIFESDLLISRMAEPICRSCILPKLDFPTVTAVDVTIVRPDESIADKKYLNYYLNSPNIQQQVHKYIAGTTRARISRKNLEKIRIPLPPLPVQKKIVAILNRADRTRRLHQEVEGHIDEFLKSVFIEMFGDPVTNPKGWDEPHLEKLLHKRKGALQSGPFGTHLHNSDFITAGEILAVGVDNVFEGRFEIGRDRRISKEKYSELEKFALQPDDVLITIMGTIGRSCVFPEWVGEAICTKHVYRIQVDKSQILPGFLTSSFRYSQKVRHQLGASVTGQIVDGITSTDLRKLNIPLPPLPLQKKFAEIVENVEQLRQQQQQSSQETDDLFNALMQKAFQGELT